MVYLTTVNFDTSVPVAELASGPSINKSGSRREYKLDVNHSFVQRIVSDLHITKPLRFASLMEAMPRADQSQQFHMDSNDTTRTNAIVYLTDVPEASHGAIEFQGIGPVVGSRGTAAVYSADEMHRGVANASQETRYALTMAFADSEANITTIGAGVSLPVSGPSTKQDWLFAVVLLAGLYYLYKSSLTWMPIALVAVALTLAYAYKRTEPEVYVVDVNGADVSSSFSHTFTSGSKGFNTIRFKIVNGIHYDQINDVDINNVDDGAFNIDNVRMQMLNVGPSVYTTTAGSSLLFLNNFTGNVTADTIYEVYFPSPVNSFRFYTND